MNQDPLRDLWRSDAQRTTPRLAEIVTLRLFCERQADDSELPAGQRGGWWADPSFGSRLWVYAHGGRMTDATPERVKAACEEALQPLLDDGTASAIVVTVERHGVDDLRVAVDVTQNDGSEVRVLYPALWAAMRGGI